MQDKLERVLDGIRFTPSQIIAIETKDQNKFFFNCSNPIQRECTIFRNEVKMVEVYDRRIRYYVNQDDGAFGGYRLTIEDGNLYIEETVSSLLNVFTNNYEYASFNAPVPLDQVLMYSVKSATRFPHIKYDPNMRCLTLH